MASLLSTLLRQIRRSCQKNTASVFNRFYSQGAATDRDYRRLEKLTVKEAVYGQYIGPCQVCGWVKHIRIQKHIAFIHITDDITNKHLQLVISPSNLPVGVSYGASVKASGELAESPAKGQTVELQTNTLELMGTNENETFPFVINNRTFSSEYIRKFLHLRIKHPEFAALLRIRSSCKQAMHNYLLGNSFIQIDTPVLTSNDCEGGGDVFSIAPANNIDGNRYFGEESHAYLTVSAQLHLEACNSGMSKVYSFGPAFRADNATDRTHLSEFYMLEAEIAFIDAISDLEKFIEELVKVLSKTVIEDNSRDIEILQKESILTNYVDPTKMLSQTFHKLSYNDAITLLKDSSTTFEKSPVWGEDLRREHEHAILAAHDNIPLFISDWPAKLKPFYMHLNDDGETVACVDLIVPGPGELLGGSLRESRYGTLEQSLKTVGLLDELNWYLDLRKYGSVPHGGFGMGFERFLQFLLGVKNIRDAIPFPRYANHCNL